jgi:crossover junction endodeoxyribonuclease RusA
VVIRFFVPGEPIPQGSVRGFARGGRVVITSDNPRLHAWRQVVALYAAQHRPAQLLDGPLHVALAFAMPRPPSVPRTKRRMPTCKPDIDKMERAIFDALTGVIWVDDARVTSVTKSKRYADDVAVGVVVEISDDVLEATP